jgi:hypothetical protein
MPPDGPVEFEQYRDAYQTASTRIRRYIGLLAHAKGLPVTMEVGPGLAGTVMPATHTVTLCVRKRETVLHIDNASFMQSDELFRVTLLPRLSEAIDTLAAE